MGFAGRARRWSRSSSAGARSDQGTDVRTQMCAYVVEDEVEAVDEIVVSSLQLDQLRSILRGKLRVLQNNVNE